jgi:hypothetical protein
MHFKEWNILLPRAEEALKFYGNFITLAQYRVPDDGQTCSKHAGVTQTLLLST